MRSSSLRLRVLLAALVWIAVAFVAGGLVVTGIFRDSALRQFDQRLQQDLELLSVAVSIAADDPARRMTASDFGRVYSGRYWQADQDGSVLRSRSLWDQTLAIPPGRAVTQSTADGPDGQRLRMLSRGVTTPDGRLWRIAVAGDLVALDSETELFMRGLLPAAAWLGFILVVAALLVLRAALRPLNQLRDAVRRLQKADETAITQDFPSEVAPLIDDLNAMLEKNLRLRERGRAQAANLAHALKTPAAVLTNEVDRARGGGPFDLTVVESAVNQIHAAATRHVSLSTGRADDQPNGLATDAVDALEQIARAIDRLFPDIAVTLDTPARADLAMAEADLLELFGNLMENAGKWAKSKINVALVCLEDSVAVTIDDDGRGVAPKDRAHIMRQGVRLDESTTGSGLGLAIVSDIVERQDGALVLEKSPTRRHVCRDQLGCRTGRRTGRRTASLVPGRRSGRRLGRRTGRGRLWRRHAGSGVRDHHHRSVHQDS